MTIRNRSAGLQADYLLMIVRRPQGWTPDGLEDVPPNGEVLSIDYVASYAEAHDDLLRCNRLALQHQLERWAIVESAGGAL